VLQIREIVEHGDAADVRRMIEADGNVVSVHDHEGSTMLHYAALFDRQSVAELLRRRP